MKLFQTLGVLGVCIGLCPTVYVYGSDSKVLSMMELMVRTRSLFVGGNPELSKRCIATRTLFSGKVYDDVENDELSYRNVNDVKLEPPKWAELDFIDIAGLGSFVARSSHQEEEDDSRFLDGDEIAILYAHGGRLVAGNAQSYASLLTTWTRPLSAAIVVPEYSLAPEVSVTFAPEEFAATYKSIVASAVSPKKIIVASDGAGACVVLTALAKLQKEGSPMPAGVILLSPSVDMVRKHDPYKHDRFITGRALNELARIADTEEHLKMVSPLRFGDETFFRELPPTMILYDGDDMSAEESKELIKRLRDVKTPVNLIYSEGLWQNWLLLHFLFPEGIEDMSRVRHFVDEVTGRDPSPMQTAIPPHRLMRIFQNFRARLLSNDTKPEHPDEAVALVKGKD